MNTPRASAADAAKLDSSLGRYAVAASVAITASLSADAAITNFTQVGGFSIPGDNDSASFNFSQFGININFYGNRYFASYPGYFTGDPSSTYTTTSGSVIINPGSETWVPGSFFRSARISASEANVAFAGRFNFGDTISGFNSLAMSSELISTDSSSTGFAPFRNSFGAFADGMPGYLGFRANVGSSTFIGWLRVGVELDGNGRPIAFNIIPDGEGIVGAFAPLSEGITAGATAIPEHSTAAMGLGLLALGAAGLRRRRALAAAGRN
jgi:hypothetical protein